MKRGYQAISRAAPYVSDAVAGYLTDGVAGAVARPAARAARELLPDAFTNNRAKRRAGIPIDLPLPRGLLRDKPVNPLNGYQIQARRDAAKLAAVRAFETMTPSIQIGTHLFRRTMLILLELLVVLDFVLFVMETVRAVR